MNVAVTFSVAIFFLPSVRSDAWIATFVKSPPMALKTSSLIARSFFQAVSVSLRFFFTETSAKRFWVYCVL